MTIEPGPSPIAAIACLQTRNEPLTLTAITWSKTSSGYSATDAWLPNTPALAKATFSPPKRSTASRTAPATAAESVTSPTAPTATSAPSSETTRSTPSASMSATTTFAPSAAKALAVAPPMLPPPPVTSATFPSRRGTSGSFEHDDGDRALRLRLVLVVGRPVGHHLGPQRRLLLVGRVAGAHFVDLVAHLHLRVRIGLEVQVPGRRHVGPALRRDDQQVVPVAAVDQRVVALLTGLAPGRGEDEGLRPLPVVAHLATGLPVAADMLV